MRTLHCTRAANMRAHCLRYPNRAITPSSTTQLDQTRNKVDGTLSLEVMPEGGMGLKMAEATPIS